MSKESNEEINQGSDDTNNQSNNKEGVGRYNPRNYRGDFKEKLEERGVVAAEQAAEKAATAYAGVVAGKVAKKVTGKFIRSKNGKKIIYTGVAIQYILPIFFALTLITAVVMFIFASPSSEYPEPSESVVKDTPAEYLEAYQQAAEKYDIPWTLLASLGKNATDHGRVSPYDDIRRDNSIITDDQYEIRCVRGVCNKIMIEKEEELNGIKAVYACDANRCGVFPAIGSKKSEARGPLLITPDEIRSANSDGNDDFAQNIYEAADYLAYKIAEERDEILLNESNIYGNWQYDYSVADKLWREVVDKLPVANPDEERAGCELAGKSVVEMVRSSVYCQSRDYDLRVIVDIDESNIAKTLNQSKSKELLYKEAISVAYAFSKLGKNSCNNRSRFSGVFPLTFEQARDLGISDRCDQRANIEGAIKLLLEQEVTVTRDIEPRYKQMVGGWEIFNQALGSYEEQSSFYKLGPPRIADVDIQCTVAVENWLNIISSSGESIRAEDVVNDERFAPPSKQAVCQESFKNEYLWNSIAGASAAGLLNLANESEVESVTDSTYLVNLNSLNDYFNNKITELREFKGWGVTSAIPRLSRFGVGVQIPKELWSTATNIPYSLKVVSLMVSLGGSVPNDLRYDQSIDTSRLSTSSLGLTLYIDYNLVPSIWEAPFPINRYSGCGSPANIDDYSRPELVYLFENMCKTAESEGVNLRITSSTRSNIQQVRLYKEKGPSLAARPAVFQGGKWYGGSPHEMGIALDIDTVYGGGVDWMHSIVGCYSTDSKSFMPYNSPIDRETYADSVQMGLNETRDIQGDTVSTCGDTWVPVKRLNLFGLAVLCLSPSSMARGDTLATPEVIRCRGKMPSGFTREEWHIQPGRSLSVKEGVFYSGVVGSDTLSLIKNVFPAEEVDNAIKIAQASSSLQQDSVINYLDGSNGWGLFALNDNGELQELYAEIALNRKIKTGDLESDKFKENAITWSLDPTNNIKAAALLWSKCDWNRWELDQNRVKSKDLCKEAGARNRRSSINI